MWTDGTILLALFIYGGIFGYYFLVLHKEMPDPKKMREEHQKKRGR